MKTITTIGSAMLAATLLIWGGPGASAHEVPGQKLDSGLGALPPYRLWDDPSGRQPMRHRVVGESLDDGLGELPPYSQWLDRSGRDPMGRGTTLARR